MTRLLVTGARGWIGGALARALAADGADHAALDARRALSAQVDPLALRDSTLVHLAAIAHRARATPDALRAVNHELAIRVAAQASELGVRRFVFVSTARVVGDSTAHRASESTPAAPADAYSAAKWAAECELMRMHREQGLQVTIVRPPLVYGPGVRANFLRLLRWADSRWPLLAPDDAGPRSMIFLDNLVSALRLAATHPQAAGRTFFVRDADCSTPELLVRMRRALGRTAGTLRVPGASAGTIARLARCGRLWDKAFAPALLDDAAFRALGWVPPVAPDAALTRTVEWFRAQRG